MKLFTTYNIYRDGKLIAEDVIMPHWVDENHGGNKAMKSGFHRSGRYKGFTAKPVGTREARIKPRESREYTCDNCGKVIISETRSALINHQKACNQKHLSQYLRDIPKEILVEIIEKDLIRHPEYSDFFTTFEGECYRYSDFHGTLIPWKNSVSKGSVYINLHGYREEDERFPPRMEFSHFVMECHGEERPSLFHRVMYLDGNPLNCAYDNLQWFHINSGDLIEKCRRIGRITPETYLKGADKNFRWLVNIYSEQDDRVVGREVILGRWCRENGIHSTYKLLMTYFNPGTTYRGYYCEILKDMWGGPRVGSIVFEGGSSVSL